MIQHYDFDSMLVELKKHKKLEIVRLEKLEKFVSLKSNLDISIPHISIEIIVTADIENEIHKFIDRVLLNQSELRRINNAKKLASDAEQLYKKKLRKEGFTVLGGIYQEKEG